MFLALISIMWFYYTSNCAFSWSFYRFLTSLLTHSMYSNAHLRCRVPQNSFDQRCTRHHSHPCKIGPQWEDCLSLGRNIHDSVTSCYLIVQGVQFSYQWPHPSISWLRLQEKYIAISKISNATSFFICSGMPTSSTHNLSASMILLPPFTNSCNM